MADDVRVIIDTDKLMQSVNREIKRWKREGIESMSAEDRRFVGQAAMTSMKTYIAAGISPISGYGRFPGYKWVEAGNLLQAKAARIGRVSRLRGLSSSKHARVRAKALRAEAKATRRKGYPASVRHRYPDKQDRPVNLWLSGKFLKALGLRFPVKGVAIGFYQEPYSLYEQGHREGANGQPKRPIIPQQGETFIPNIMRDVIVALRQKLIERMAKVVKS